MILSKKRFRLGVAIAIGMTTQYNHNFAFAQVGLETASIIPANVSPLVLPHTPNPSLVCSQLSLPEMIELMLRDLPGYANRVSQRARRLKRQGETFSYILIAGKANFQPLPLNPQPTSRIPGSSVSSDVSQVFFTTLERRYTAGKAVEMQQYHWLLLTPTDIGWRQVSLRSQTGSYPAQPTKNPAPPRNSSDGVVGQAVNLWLRDCRANSIKLNE